MTVERMRAASPNRYSGELISREDRGRLRAAVPFRMRLARARRLPHMKPRVDGGFQVSRPLIVSIPHHLGREEAARRIKSGLAAARASYSALLTIREETWTGDRLAFNLSALGQSAIGVIDVADDHVRLEVQLPWLLAMVAEKLTPAIRKEGTLMLEKK